MKDEIKIITLGDIFKNLETEEKAFKFKNYITNLQEKSNNQAEEINRLVKQREKFMKKYGYLKEEKDKYKNVIDKIKEYIITRTPSDIGICGNEPKKYYTLNEDEVDYILELLEEVE